MLTKIKKFLFENKGTGQKIAKNTFWLFFGQITGRLIRMAIVIYAARILGPTSWGAFSYAMSLIAFFLILSDIGIGAIVTRETARDLNASNKYFSTAFFIKSILLIIGIFILILGAPYLTKIEEVKALIPALAFILLFDSLRNFGFALSRAHEKMEWEGINEIITNIAISFLGFAFLAISQTSKALMISYAIAIGIGFFMIAWKLRSYFKNLVTYLDFKLIKPILTMAWPFALASSLGAIMINTDTIMIGWLRSAEEVGYYSASQRPIQLMYILPSLFAASLFPTLSKLARENNEKFKNLLEIALSVSILVALPITLNGIILADQIIDLLFGPAYQNAIPSFQILLLTIIIIFPSIIISNAIFAHDQQKKFITFSALGAFGNVLFNFLLIGPLGIIGCSISTVITQIIANSFMWKKMKKISPFSIYQKINKIIIASLLTSAMVLIFKIFSINVLITILSGGATYVILLYILKEKLLMQFIKNNTA